ncbi:pyroglutamyl-peptidase I [Cupriavidus necator]|uniref:Pyrrolidone-carboxylate peptidase n=2 Tax=Cupriavidus necator (strain ATCC 17699 / DSM 428 / KCTC 22496 / NCIMB 10442 / H16 / Stanier 337) TaxID=381666 RepID=PCP_CUPNH|nr:MULTISPECIES: pyroglutamyl-peptidase I [Cupriavidus]Q0KFE0.1 RecName: Full=Pyrrolidone-carboxylate peptidase; AltName: Full=5-oxoprolyl-peptidase; AltName: Full=Pyroglutamyl-peptidase I; Short=PGP-I; Short=Pyrase [Cupriavidus necator H16]EON19490.1 pyrrolidone-carboxylate peptidase [Cupriavidus sp. GA3-3]KUE88326.1 pyrrolidone-carboxylate peptidase [Cupriavidus necator]QCB99242.1 pyroglutamyl-peptidase I [Cupriavidus necator H16]QQB77940.1 pyroglutamyl-peptidase I [Cupriavidus necator]WKA4
MRTVLLTGFEPFENEPINPSWEAVRALDGERVGDAVIVARQLPCVFGAAIDTIGELVDVLRPALVIAVGQAGGRAEMSVERVAINVDDARIADNAGAQPIDTAIVAGGPAAYFATLPIKAMVRDMRAAGVPASVSQTAGTFVCNHVFYGLMHRLSQQPDGDVRGGFIHIPYLPEQAARHPGQPSLAQETLVKGLRAAVATALSTRADVREQGGQLH